MKGRPDECVQIYTEDQLEEKYGIKRERVELKTRIFHMAGKNFTCSYERCWMIITSFIPILRWLPQYKIKDFLLSDIFAGFTIASVQLPQAVSYATLASMPPVHGLYASFIPVLIYSLLGTVRQVSIGTFSIICIMVGEVIDEHVPEPACTSSIKTNISDVTTTSSYATDGCKEEYLNNKISIAIAICMAVGLIQLLMFLIRLGIVTVYLSETLVSAFTCAAVYHALMSQIPKLIGITVPKHSGPLALIYTIIDIFSNLDQINWFTVAVSAICIIFLVIGKNINSRYHETFPVPIPLELSVVIFSTLASHYGLLYDKHGISVVGDIPTGLKLSVPRGADIGVVMIEAIPIAVVIYAIEVSMGKMFALKHSYEIDSNQELFALGVANLASSFFSSIPCAASLSRSAILDEAGGRTQVTGLVSSGLILVILLWIGPFFESLPEAALASIIVVSLKRLLVQFVRIPSYWRIYRPDAMIWVVTWLAVIFLGFDVGLLVGLVFEFTTVIFRTQRSNGDVLGEVPGSGSYKSANRYRTNKDPNENIVVYAYNGPLYFANHQRFRAQLSGAIGFDPLQGEASVEYTRAKKDGVNENHIIDQRQPHAREVENNTFVWEVGAVKTQCTDLGTLKKSNTSEEECEELGVRTVILDMSSCSFLDNDGAKTLKDVFSSLRILHIPLLLASCTDDTRRTLETACQHVRPKFFLTLERAVQFARGRSAGEYYNDRKSTTQQTPL